MKFFRVPNRKNRNAWIFKRPQIWLGTLAAISASKGVQKFEVKAWIAEYLALDFCRR